MNTYARFFLAIIMVVAFTGCGRVVITSDIIEQAIELCEENGGLKDIDQVQHLFPNYTCKNGVRFKIYNERISKTYTISGDIN